MGGQASSFGYGAHHRAGGNRVAAPVADLVASPHSFDNLSGSMG
jgi:hypothetical protein